jgi:hypothetical protein
MIRNITDVNWVCGVESKDSSNRLALLPVAEAQGIAGQVDNARLNFGVGKNHRNEKYQLFCVWVVFFKLIGCYKMAPRLIHNRPGPVRCENAWYRSVTSQQRTGPEKGDCG